MCSMICGTHLNNMAQVTLKITFHHLTNDAAKEARDYVHSLLEDQYHPAIIKSIIVDELELNEEQNLLLFSPEPDA